MTGLNGLGTIAVAAAAIVWVEWVRDTYHWLSHRWSWLYRLHGIHHRTFRPDLSADLRLYRRSQWINDVPECLVMLLLSLLPWYVWPQWTALAGTAYTTVFLLGAIARGSGWARADELTDLTHQPGKFSGRPGNWFVNREYHWRHHFDNQRAYYCSTLTIFDKLMGTALSLSGKRVAVTGASGTLGRALLEQLRARGAKVVALSSRSQPVVLSDGTELETLTWKVGGETELIAMLERIDILVLNHGINVHGDRSPAAIAQSYEVNTFSSWRLMEAFLQTVRTNTDIARKEVWVNTSEAEVGPAISPLYELSKRALGDLVTLRRLDAPCTIRKLILGPFKSNLNPIGVMSADWVAAQILNLAVRDARNIVVTVNPLTFLAFPMKECCVSAYFRLFGRASRSDANVAPSKAVDIPKVSVVGAKKPLQP
ncbi:dehydrogenase with different specificities [Rubidibacter lacunae KORDI 51-2]|uniref:Dehydrogenase with different specificities n=1 Tax=Rubidibacter lacunae KORDI 51-2 TaxID=582515 RepID=U5DKA3_9CHRO|nr:bifunctional sterol desaturase/short chain dehydrogenase [Rubidibacter lacunae]ERN40115.1 dehydrogenase with different specificities [Rubidibacter lacunae KORDI 51-2]